MSMTDFAPTMHDQVLGALHKLIETDPFFPDHVDLDAPQPHNLRKNPPGETVAMSDHCSVQDGQVEVTRDSGAQNDYELQLPAKVVYVVQCADDGARRRRRGAGAARISWLIRNNRQLGLDDPQIYAEIGDVDRDDQMMVPGAGAFAMVAVTVNILFVAESPAG